MKLWFRKSQGADTAVATETAVSEDVLVIDDPTGALDTSPGKPPASVNPPAQAQPPAPAASAAEKPAGAQAPNGRSLFKQLLAGLYDAVLITDVKGHVINTNGRMTESFGYTADETWNLPIDRLVPGINDVLIAKILQGLTGERYVMIEGRCTRKDQSTFPAEIAISRIELVNDGNLLFCVRNIERRQVQVNRLRIARRLLDQIPVAAVACDRKAIIRVINLPMARMLGYDTADTLTDQPFSCVWNEPRAAEVVQLVLAGEMVKEPIAMVNRRGHQLNLVATLTPDLDAHSKVGGFLATFTSAAVVSLNPHSGESKD